MKKVIFCLCISVIFQQCTDELHEIDAVVSSQVEGISAADLKGALNDIPHNAYSAFYYYSGDRQEFVQHRSETNINHNFRTNRTMYDDLGVFWTGDFEFESGDYELNIKSDETIKVLIDDAVVFEGSNMDPDTAYKTKLTLEGIHRLKVLYNLNNKQKVEKIIEYYQKLNGEKDGGNTDHSSKISVLPDGVKNSENPHPDVAMDWKRL
ncbi:MAG: PA14 domain-containing protein [Cytophagales bacterium]|nr:PA14 domain-containing protein [Cytophagales bacterium]